MRKVCQSLCLSVPSGQVLSPSPKESPKQKISLNKGGKAVRHTAMPMEYYYWPLYEEKWILFKGAWTWRHIKVLPHPCHCMGSSPQLKAFKRGTVRRVRKGSTAILEHPFHKMPTVIFCFIIRVYQNCRCFFANFTENVFAIKINVQSLCLVELHQWTSISYSLYYYYYCLVCSTL